MFPLSLAWNIRCVDISALIFLYFKYFIYIYIKIIKKEIVQKSINVNLHQFPDYLAKHSLNRSSAFFWLNHSFTIQTAAVANWKIKSFPP